MNQDLPPKEFAIVKLIGVLDREIDNAISQDAEINADKTYISRSSLNPFECVSRIFKNGKWVNNATPKRHRTMLIKTWLIERNLLAEKVGGDHRPLVW